MAMTAAQWTKLITSIPEECWDGMFLELNTGMNLAIARVMKFADDYLLVRGRVGGTDEEDRLFVVPYESLMMVMFTRPMDDEKVTSIFGELLGGVRRRREDEEEKDKQNADEAREKLKKDAEKLTEAFAPQTPAGPQAPGTSTLRERLLRPRPGMGPSIRRPRPNP